MRHRRARAKIEDTSVRISLASITTSTRQEWLYGNGIIASITMEFRPGVVMAMSRQYNNGSRRGRLRQSTRASITMIPVVVARQRYLVGGYNKRLHAKAAITRIVGGLKDPAGRRFPGRGRASLRVLNAMEYEMPIPDPNEQMRLNKIYE